MNPTSVFCALAALTFGMIAVIRSVSNRSGWVFASILTAFCVAGAYVSWGR